MYGQTGAPGKPSARILGDPEGNQEGDLTHEICKADILSARRVSVTGKMEETPEFLPLPPSAVAVFLDACARTCADMGVYPTGHQHTPDQSQRVHSKPNKTDPHLSAQGTAGKADRVSPVGRFRTWQNEDRLTLRAVEPSFDRRLGAAPLEAVVALLAHDGVALAIRNVAVQHIACARARLRLGERDARRSLELVHQLLFLLVVCPALVSSSRSSCTCRLWQWHRRVERLWLLPLHDTDLLITVHTCQPCRSGRSQPPCIRARGGH